MLVIVGANGRTGLELIHEAQRRNIDVRAVVRDDRDARNLDAIIDVQHICYANPDHYEQLPPALEGATEIIICVDPRTGGPGTPIYGEESAPNIVLAGKECGAKTIIYLSVMGAFRWSPNSLNRKAFHLDRGVRALDAPWTVFRVSSYIDEVIDGHVRPPDGGRPHKIRKSSRYSPVSRRDVAKMVLDYLPTSVPGRQVCVGGPEIITGEALEAMLIPWREAGRGRSIYKPLPPGDVSVFPESTRVTVGMIPNDHLADFLDPSSEPPEATEPPPVYARPQPGPHESDKGQDYKVLQPWGDTLRRVIHTQLFDDLARLGLSNDNIWFDFSKARKKAKARSADAHEGEFTQLNGVRVVDAELDIAIHTGGIDFLRDKNAEEFHCWWTGDGIPEPMWRTLDMGVQRRMVAAGHWDGDPLIETFRQQNNPK